jgi:hypothetical protein
VDPPLHFLKMMGLTSIPTSILPPSVFLGGEEHYFPCKMPTGS